MPEWWIERGIGETRAVLVEDGEIVEARVQLDGQVPTGAVIAAKLTSIGANGRNAVARAVGGAEYLLPRGAGGVSEGTSVNIEVTREAIPGREPWKRPLARVTEEEPRDAPPLAGRELPFPAPRDDFAEVGWNDLLEEARCGIVRFAGGELRISPTPAMTLIDVDGHLPAEELAVAGAREAARTIRRFDVGGSIGIDLPTVGSKAARQQATAVIDAVLPRPFERTAVNGFGFVQIVRPRLRASLVELAQDRARFEGRLLLRRAAFEAPGGKRLVAHPAVVKTLEDHSGWVDALARQIGGAVELRSEPTLPMSAGYAESL
ncbi:MAG TPA: ribonuclease [Sphingomicrobium sp.]|nr:ribonuclease [Sphingomicrobium sp.]